MITDERSAPDGSTRYTLSNGATIRTERHRDEVEYISPSGERVSDRSSVLFDSFETGDYACAIFQSEAFGAPKPEHMRRRPGTAGSNLYAFEVLRSGNHGEKEDVMYVVHDGRCESQPESWQDSGVWAFSRGRDTCRNKAISAGSVLKCRVYSLADVAFEIDKATADGDTDNPAAELSTGWLSFPDVGTSDFPKGRIPVRKLGVPFVISLALHPGFAKHHPSHTDNQSEDFDFNTLVGHEGGRYAIPLEQTPSSNGGGFTSQRHVILSPVKARPAAESRARVIERIAGSRGSSDMK